MPSKGLLRPVEVLHTARQLPGVASLVGRSGLDVDAVLARRDAIVNNLDDDSQVRWALDTGIDVVRGYGRLAAERTVEVTAPDGSVRTITARHAVVVDTGSHATVPDIPGLRAARPWTSRDVTHLREIPQRVAVLGGGVVACEATTWLRGLGVAELTLVHRGSGLLTQQEPFAGELVAAELQKSGVNLLLGRKVVAVRRDEVAATVVGAPHGGPATLTLDDGSDLTVDELVVAMGRTPNTGDIGLSRIGRPDGGYLEVDDHQAVKGVPGRWLYAIGDVCGRALLTHMGKYQARIVGEVIASRASAPDGASDGGAPGGFAAELNTAQGHRAVPQVTFTDPEVASVGLTERKAREAGIDVETAEYDMAALAGTYLLREGYTGRAKLVVDRATDTLVGATFVGSGVADLLHSATVAVVGRVPLSTLWHAVPSYPTPSEIWLRLLETLNRQRRLAPGHA
jgi:dihydrolipoamide dehydrogenase